MCWENKTVNLEIYAQLKKTFQGSWWNKDISEKKKIERLPLTDFTKENYSRTRDADIEYRYTHTRRQGTNWERSIDIHTLSYVKQTATGKLLYSTGSSVMMDAGCWMLDALWWPWVMGWGGWRGREAQKGGTICTHIADSLCFTAETNTTLYSNYTLIKNKKEVL